MKRLQSLLIPMAFLNCSEPQGFAQDAGAEAVPNAVELKTTRPTVCLVFFMPSDLRMPAGVRQRLTKIADATEKFFFQGMNRWGYPPGAESLFRREAGGLVEVLNLPGDMPLSSGKYGKPNYAEEVITQATRQYQVAREGQVWWIFIYLGDRPVRFQNFAGAGNPRDGGWAMVNYDSLPGEVNPDLGLAEGFNGRIHVLLKQQHGGQFKTRLCMIRILLQNLAIQRLGLL